MLPDPRIIAEKFALERVEVLPRDASARHYFRGYRQDKSVIVMLYPEAMYEHRAELLRFLDISKLLEKQGIKVAECYEYDETETYALLEDLGRHSFGECLHKGKISPENLYTMATQILINIKDVKNADKLPHYKQNIIYANRRQLIDYYMAFKQGQHPDENCIDQFHTVWDKIEQNLPSCPQCFVHGDYHLENLIWASDETDLRQCALIDYQDAFYGPLPYDLVNLLEDARVDVLEDIRSSMINLYTKNMSKEEKESFLAWYRVSAMQFNGRVIGLFIKFAVEQNRDSYLIHIPRLQNHIKRHLRDPVLRPLKEYFEETGLDFDPIIDLDGEKIREVFKNM
ncbi:MAG: phosphotransferase [Alphaproteobacteria bacterium]|nr:phosphotransferase [Alphaproteobacteria bacterium]